MEEKDKQLAKEISEEVVSEIKKEMPKFSLGRKYNLIKDVVSIVLILVVVVFGIKLYKSFEINKTEVAPVEEHDLTLENDGILGFTVADFEDAILGTASKKALLIVDEQELSVPSVITQTGLFNLGVFTKNQSVTYYGIGQYTVNLETITKDSISVDEESNTVIVKVPHPELHNVIFDTKKTVFGSSEKGLLAFGEIKLTVEEQNKVEQEAVKKLEERALESDCVEKANKYAMYVLRDFFEVAIGEVTETYKIKIEFSD